ncbi:MAG TPA: FAD-dependent monooxygenase [Baekduia sp.]|nr:FAD-dependent monooxygenase [Baekduia sp.]
MERCDVVVVGGRLAGACAAAHFARLGRRTVVLDRSRFPSDQLSTHLMFPSGIDEWRRMGALDGILALDPTKSPWLQLTAPDGTKVLERWRPVGDIDYCLCIPRPLQDLELVKAARAAGADVRERCDVTGVIWRGGRAAGVRYVDADGTDHELRAKLVVGADGRRSSIAGFVGAFRPYRASRNGRGLVFRYLDDPRYDTPEGQVIFQFRDGDSLGMAFPSAPRGRMLALFMGPAGEASEARKDPEGHWARKLAQHPGLAARLEGATNMTKLRTTGDTTAFFRASSGPGWALIGDAGHFKDPVIAQGQRDALWTGRTVAEAAADRLDDPGALDLALRCWEASRDAECLHAWHFANIETVTRPVPAVLVEVFREAARTPDPDIGDLFGRTRTMPEVLPVTRLVRAFGRALRHRDGPATAVVRDAVEDLGVQLRVRAELRRDAFRSSRLLPGSDHPEPHPPEPPRARPAAAPEPAAAVAG